MLSDKFQLLHGKRLFTRIAGVDSRIYKNEYGLTSSSQSVLFYIANKIKVCYLINRIYSKTKF